jgi:hypothetical protein
LKILKIIGTLNQHLQRVSGHRKPVAPGLIKHDVISDLVRFNRCNIKGLKRGCKGDITSIPNIADQRKRLIIGRLSSEHDFFGFVEVYHTVVGKSGGLRLFNVHESARFAPERIPFR